ncbi:hypothetical protein BGZ47_008651 [Haplosporangium gracile]|nr:hypothetical protein BGZ47_008651 [Haplosporangium gracile]
MPPTIPTKEVPRGASRVEEDPQEQRPRSRRRLSTGSTKNWGKGDDTSEAQASGGVQGATESIEGVGQELGANDTPGSHIDQDDGTAEKTVTVEQDQIDLVSSWVAKRYSQSPVRPPLPSMMARKYELWKDDLDFVAERDVYWGTVAPRLADRRSESHQPQAHEVEQEEEDRPSCAPCLVQGRECSKERPICTQCQSENDVTSTAEKAPTMCSYPVGKTSVSDSRRQSAKRKRRRNLEANLAVAVEYLGGELDESEGEELSNDDPSNDNPSNDGPSNDEPWRVGVQGERDPDEEAESAVKESARSEWLAKALFAEDEGRGYHGPAKIPRKRGRPWKIPPEEQPIKIRRPVGRPRKVPTGEELVKIRRPVGRPRKVPMEGVELYESDKPLGLVRSVSQERKAVKIAILKAKLEEKPKGKGKGKDKDKDKDKHENTAKVAPQRREFTTRVMERYLKDTTRKLNALGTWTEVPNTFTGDQEQKGLEVVAKAGVKDESDEETATPVISKYKEQIASTFRPWVAQKDEKVIPSACDLPDTSLLQALHYYASYYYTHVSPSPDMFEAMDLTSHIALSMIVQEIISDFAFKLGKDSQLEDIQVKIDKLVAAQHGDKWGKDFLEYLESRAADGPLLPKQPAKKLRYSGSVDGSAESPDESCSDTNVSENEDKNHDAQTWDELEDLRRTTTFLGVHTVKELVNRTRFDISVEEALEANNLDGEKTGGRFSTSSLHTDSDLDSSDDSDANSTRAGNGGWSAQSTLKSVMGTPFRIALGSDSEISLSDEEDTEMPVRNSTRSTTGGSKMGSLDDDDMPEIDFSPSILTQLSNNRFGSQLVFGLDDSSSDDDNGSTELDGPTMVPSQVLQEDSDESSEAEGGSSESDSEQEVTAMGDKEEKEEEEEEEEEKEGKKEEDDKDSSNSDEDEPIQEDDEDTYGASKGDDSSPSVLTQTGLGSAFKFNQEESSSDVDGFFNPSGGRFVVQSQVLQDDSDDDSSEVQEDSFESDSEQEDEEDEDKDIDATKDTEEHESTKEYYLEDDVAAENKKDNRSIKEAYIEDDKEKEEEEEEEEVPEIDGASNYGEDNAESSELPEHLSEREVEESDAEMEAVEENIAAETVVKFSTREQSQAGSKADVDMDSDVEYKTHGALMEKDDRSDEEDQGETLQPVYTTVSATRFGSQFSTSYNADGDDDSEEEGASYGGTQSQVVYNDSTTSEEENLQSSSDED